MAKKVLLITSEPRPDIELAGRNIERLTLASVAAINVLDVLHADAIVVEHAALAAIQVWGLVS
jgi:ribosomal protein L4